MRKRGFLNTKFLIYAIGLCLSLGKQYVKAATDLAECGGKENTCASIGVTSTHCKRGDIIYKTSNEEGACAAAFSNVGSHFFASDGTEPETNSASWGIAYTCDATSKCKVAADGYYVNSKIANQNLGHIVKVTSGEIETINTVLGENYALTDGTGISCSAANDCTAIKNAGYFLNSGEDKNTKPLIYCVTGTPNISCTSVSAEPLGYYLNQAKVTNETYDEIIQCSSSDSCTSSYPGDGFYLNVGKDKATRTLIKCTANTSCKLVELKAENINGYCLDKGSNNENLIYCSEINNCESKKMSPGYYVDKSAVLNVASRKRDLIERTDTIAILTCDGLSCKEYIPKSCNTALQEFKSGNSCIVVDVLYFVKKDYKLENAEEFTTDFINENLINSSDVSEDKAKYAFAKVEGSQYPGATSTVSTLFKITKNSITRVSIDGIIAINKNTNLIVKDFSKTDINIISYKCEKSLNSCVLNTCLSDTYSYDETNGLGLYCNSGKLELVTSPGNYVDGSRNGNNYILDCEDKGICSSKKVESYSYFINAGFDSNKKKLIFCNGTTCETVEAKNGNYILGKEDGLITCTSTNTCTSTKIYTINYYVNAGSNRKSKSLIYCQKGKCNYMNAQSGYYASAISNVLLNCNDPSNCVETTISTPNYYNSAEKADSKQIINCVNNNNVISCNIEPAGDGFYVSDDSNILINCTKSGEACTIIIAENGIFASATTTSSNSNGSSQRSEDEKEEKDKDKKSSKKSEKDTEDTEESNSRSSTITHNLISCTNGNCNELSPSELANIPICSIDTNKCYITTEYASTNPTVGIIAAGGYCTNNDRTKLYFATDSIVIQPSTIGAQTSTYTYTTTNSNCIEVSEKYNTYYYTVGPNIYHLDVGQISQITANGYYFINVITNVLATGTNIDVYNDANVKLYKCDGVSCKILDKPSAIAYYVDINKRIIKYNVNSNSYSFASSKDIQCEYSNNKCTPNTDLKNNEFCINHKGELILASMDIPSRESKDCYKANNINSEIYGFNQYLYKMDSNSAIMINESAYYIISVSTNSTASVKEYDNKTTSLIMYGCNTNTCKLVTPKKDVYYYDSNSQYMAKYENGIWKMPTTSGFALVSQSPSETYIYKFSIDTEKKIKFEGKVDFGFYYTVDEEMYECTNESQTCSKIDETDYIFTNSGEIYYCVYDSENIEKTVCTIQKCNIGQYYYINNNYYRCEAGSILSLVSSKYCVYSEKVVINFPTIFDDEYPESVKFAIESISKNNNSTAITNSGKNSLSVVDGVFTNCTYNAEDKVAQYDLVCISNFVSVNDESESVEICSTKNLGYVECVEDENNPQKCNPSSAYTQFTTTVVFVLATLLSLYFTISNQ